MGALGDFVVIWSVFCEYKCLAPAIVVEKTDDEDQSRVIGIIRNDGEFEYVMPWESLVH